MSEQTPLLSQNDEEEIRNDQERKIRRFLTAPLLFVLLVVMFILVFLNGDDLYSYWLLRGDPHSAAKRILSRWPVIDGHIDLPVVYRYNVANNISAINLREPTLGHVDIPRLREGRVGAFWWSTWVACPEEGHGNGTFDDFTKPNWRVRDTLEQIDVAKLAIEQYPDTFQLALTANDAREAMRDGKVASFIGIEGAHQIGNSLGVLRRMHDLGVRYMTLTHTCHNAFADSAGFLIPLPPLHFGLSELGKELILEMNRLGIIVDLSHTSDRTALQALSTSRAPVIWSHSSAREVWDVPRNVPNDILSRIGTTEDKRDAVVMVNFAPYFVAADGEATVEKVADHVEMIARVAGKKHVGIGSDFDGIESTPVGLEDVSKYPNLFAVLIKRGWSASDLAGLAGANFLRVFKTVERVSKQMKEENVPPSMALYSKRPDLPVPREL